MEKTLILILAAGKGTRMRSKTSKVMHPLGGKPLLYHVIETAQALNPEKIGVVLAPDATDLKETIHLTHDSVDLHYAAPLGTGYAVKEAFKAYPNFQGTVLILFGDVPLIQKESLQDMLDYLDQTPLCGSVVLTMQAPQPNAYGKIVLKEGRWIEAIVEDKEATQDIRNLPLSNSGILAFRAPLLRDLLEKIEPANTAGEYYLTDAIGLMKETEFQAHATVTSFEQVIGINTRLDLAFAEEIFQQRLREKMLLGGVTLLDPPSVYFSADTTIAQDVTIHPHVVFGPNVSIEEDVTVHSFCHIEGAHLKKGSSVGPFARLRPKTIIGENAKIGNFVETKNATLGTSTKASHLSYLGDCTIGDKANIGAGTVICNYDGFNKWQTSIGEGVFIGSNSSLVAPLSIEKNALIAAGSVITKDVKENMLSLGRAKQTDLPEGASKIRQKNQSIKKG